MKKCELCNCPAKIHCESDQANLCWDCDARVHGANFLVAKHSRTLLCHVCQSPTPWTGSGPRLAPTISVCESCANFSEPNGDDEEDDNDGGDDGYEDEADSLNGDNREGNDHGGDDDDTDHGDEDDGENQVVPWSSSPPGSTSSTSGDCRGRTRSSEGALSQFPWERTRENAEQEQNGLGERSVRTRTENRKEGSRRTEGLKGFIGKNSLKIVGVHEPEKPLGEAVNCIFGSSWWPSNLF